MLALVPGRLARPTYVTPPARWVIVPDAIYWAEHDAVAIDTSRGRTLMADSLGPQPGRELLGEVWDYHGGRRFDRSSLNGPTVDLDGTYTVFRSFWSNHAHTLVDDIPRLTLLHDPALADRPLRLLYSGELRGAERHLLERVLPEGVTLHPVPADALVRVECLVFPEYITRRFAHYHHPRFRRLLSDRVLPRRPSRRCNRIYVSRRGAAAGGRRGVINEDELLTSLDKFGFERHVLDDMDVADQIELFYDAEFVVAPHGAGVANAMFSIGIGILELFPSRWMQPDYYFLGRSYGHCYDYLVGTAKHRNSDFTVDVRAVERKLVDVFGLPPRA
jgi:capsular polysaccharide biosynthesis protein